MDYHIRPDGYSFSLFYSFLQDITHENTIYGCVIIFFITALYGFDMFSCLFPVTVGIKV